MGKFEATNTSRKMSTILTIAQSCQLVDSPDFINDTRRDTTATKLSSNSSSDGLLKQRMGSFIARSLPNIEIRIIVGSEEVYPTDG